MTSDVYLSRPDQEIVKVNGEDKVNTRYIRFGGIESIKPAHILLWGEDIVKSVYWSMTI